MLENTQMLHFLVFKKINFLKKRKENYKMESVCHFKQLKKDQQISINEDDKILFSDIENKSDGVYLITKKDCPFCKAFEKEWIEVKSTIEKMNKERMKKQWLGCFEIDLMDERNFPYVKKNNIPGAPTIMIKKNGTVIVYPGPRTSSSLIYFFNKVKM